MNRWIVIVSMFLLALPGCGSDEGSSSEGTDSTQTDTGAVADLSGEGDASAGDAVNIDLSSGDMAGDADVPSQVHPVAGADLVGKLKGLWSGSAAQTPLGNFARMNMDMRAADEFVLFSRADLDANNSLRFAFSIETHGGEDVFIFRNGGQFTGVDRDTRTAFVDHDPVSDTWRFCAVEGGCDYVEARWVFSDPDHVLMDVDVSGFTHVKWSATRVEARTLPDGFPPEASSGEGDVAFPEMPTLDVALSWTEPAPEGAWVWIILSDTSCGFTGRGCEASRQIGASLEAGATSATLTLRQLHGGDYFLNTLLDRDGNFQTSLFPNTGDEISSPDQAINVAESGVTTINASFVITVP